MKRAIRRFLRTLAQFIAGGGITAFIIAVSQALSTSTSMILLAGNTLAVTFIQNYLEGEGYIPVLLPANKEAKPVQGG